ncbi:HNH endonuclease signature motif containing protein [Microbacterium sp. AK031]|uniref:HNH endonuclease signature motif containing protein n=1 Tax=Microbacterium sp. AK031 TaxID=2723076 RepID=UPI00216A5200|nr:HNH endonuclease signature motif containing protein [Microbacterium sp. AK031]MCS3843602.1 hypothetical protein [Microbacterium sp. AK031]
MAIFSELRDTLEGLESRMGDVDIDVLLTAMRRLDDDAIVGALAGAAAVANCAERMLTVGAGVVAERSRREAGHSGLAATRGHRNAVSLVQSIVGGTRTDAARAVRLGETLIEGADAAGAGSLGRDGSDRDGWGGNGWSGSPGDGGDGWSWGDGAGYGESNADGATGGADAGFEHGGAGAGPAGTGAGPAGTEAGSGDPGDEDAAGSHTGSSGPDDGASGGEGVGGGASAGAGASTLEHDAPMPWHEPLRQSLFAGKITPAQHDAIFRGMGQPPARDGVDSPTDAMIEVWSLAAAQLAQEAADMSVEDLARRARQVRDTLDPQGVQERFERSYAARSWRSWRNTDGQHHTHIISDDETAAWLESIRDAALRPRRGGPRFMTDEERAAASALVDDPRTNDQIAYDLFMDILRAGALANAADDGGCMFPECRVPASYCEAHHCDHWHEDLGLTDIDRGILLCRHHHMLLHNNGWKITREGLGMFMLHPPGSRRRGGPGGREAGGGSGVGGGEIERSSGDGSSSGRGGGSSGVGGGSGIEVERSSGGGDLEPIPLTSRSAIRWAWDPPPEWPHWRSMPSDVADPRLAHSA